MSKRKNESIKVIPLGGVGEVGKNMIVIEVDHEIFVIDAGLMFPENEMLGIDVVIPDITYLEENKDRVKGIFLTHGHEDAIGSLGYVLRKIKAPVYGTKLTLALAKDRLRQEKGIESVKFYTIHSDSRLRFDTVDVTFSERRTASLILSGFASIRPKALLFIRANLSLTKKQKVFINRILERWPKLAKKEYCCFYRIPQKQKDRDIQYRKV